MSNTLLTGFFSGYFASECIGCVSDPSADSEVGFQPRQRSVYCSEVGTKWGRQYSWPAHPVRDQGPGSCRGPTADHFASSRPEGERTAHRHPAPSRGDDWRATTDHRHPAERRNACCSCCSQRTRQGRRHQGRRRHGRTSSTAHPCRRRRSTQTANCGGRRCGGRDQAGGGRGQRADGQAGTDPSGDRPGRTAAPDRCVSERSACA